MSELTEERMCGWCGELYETQIENEYNMVYCSKECADIADREYDDDS